MSGYYNLVDPTLNWGVSFRYNPLFLPFVKTTETTELSYLPLNYLLFCKAFFFLPILIALFLKFRISLPFLIGAITSLMFSLFVTDFFFWSTFHVLPFTAILIGYPTKEEKFNYLRLLVGALFWSYCSGPLAFLGIFVLLTVIYNRKIQEKLLFLSTGLIASIVYLVVFPMPKYPEGAALVELSETLRWPMQLFGPHLKPNPLNYLAYTERLTSLLSTAVSNLFLSAALLLQLRNKEATVTELRLIFLTATFLVAESLTHGFFTQQLTSVMFGLSLLPFPSLLGCLGVLTSLGLFLNSKDKASPPFNLGYLILIFFFLGNLTWTSEVRTSDALPVGTQFSLGVSKDPKMAIARSNQMTSLENAVLGSSTNPLQAKFFADGKLDTRWTTNAAMKGDEWVQLNFNEPRDCSMISFSPGGDKTDFPRGVEVQVTENGLDYRQAAKFDNWLGPVRKTEEGFLYYGPQSEVEFRLAGAEKIKGLKIIQTKKDNFYYWSIAEVRCGSISSE